MKPAAMAMQSNASSRKNALELSFHKSAASKKIVTIKTEFPRSSTSKTKRLDSKSNARTRALVNGLCCFFKKLNIKRDSNKAEMMAYMKDTINAKCEVRFH